MLIDRKRNHIKERRDRQEQRLRMEQMAAKMSAKKLQRLQKVCLDVELEHVYKLTINSDRDDQRRSTDRHAYHPPLLSLPALYITCITILRS
jgi:23S rRNA maturation mini-RNase III